METIALWSQCLTVVPHSRLVLKGEVFDHSGTVRHLRDLFAAHGIDHNRIDCRGFTPQPAIFETYHDIDIALDPHPYSGCLTTCEALYMGVPVVTRPGPTFAGRHTASFLNAVGLSEWIATVEDTYVTIVKEKSRDVKALSDLRRGLRKMMSDSQLCDAATFASHLSDALHQMWDQKQA